MSPLAVLERGYAVVTNDEGKVVRHANQAPLGETLHVRLHDGELRVRVEDGG